MIFEKSDKPQVITVYNLRANTKEGAVLDN